MLPTARSFLLSCCQLFSATRKSQSLHVRSLCDTEAAGNAVTGVFVGTHKPLDLHGARRRDPKTPVFMVSEDQSQLIKCEC